MGLLAGGRPEHLFAVRLRWLGLIFAAVVVRFVTEAALERGAEPGTALRILLLCGSYGLLAAGLWVNRRQPGLAVAFVGILANGLAVLANAGWMPIWQPSLLAAGFSAADVHNGFHTILPASLDTAFLLHAGPLADVIPVPFPVIQNVASIGDVLLGTGLAFFLFAIVVRVPGEPDTQPPPEGVAMAGLAGAVRLPRTIEAAVAGRTIRAETGLVPGLAEAAALDRPFVLGGPGLGLAAPALAPLPVDVDDLVALPRRAAIPTEAPLARVRRHPYVRLALNGSFSALWVGQLISLFGDRVNQIALAALVWAQTGSAAAMGLVFVAATLPNLLLGPVAGTLVDRWDQKQVMVVSDLLRASLVLLVPIAAATEIALVYPLVFAVTAISIFFRPARTAILPRIVGSGELMTANSAAWVGETMADVLGYPLAGLFVAFLGGGLALAFWVDAATYVASALLVTTMAVPALLAAAAGVGGIGAGFREEMLAGWRFLRREPLLLANTLQGVAGQFSSGALIALTYVYASEVIRGPVDTTTVYAFLETGVGLGNLVGGFLLGLVGAHLARGRTVVLGYVLFGLCLTALPATGSALVAFALMLGVGVANMIFVIPSQTLFQERTPPGMIGRVVGIRFSLVFGSMTLAMAVAGVLAQAVGVGAVLFGCGVLTLAAGLGGLLVPAVREA